MKKFNEDIWVETQEDGTVNVGFVQAFINSKMAECFHVVQADTRRVDKDGPMLVIETNDALESIKAPATGLVSFFNTKARNFPDKLTEADVVLTIVPPDAKKKVAPKLDEAVGADIGGWAIPFEQLNPNQQQLRREAELRQAQALERVRRILNN